MSLVIREGAGVQLGLWAVSCGTVGPQRPLFLPFLCLGIGIVFSHPEWLLHRVGGKTTPSKASYSSCYHRRSSSQSSSSNTPVEGLWPAGLACGAHMMPASVHLSSPLRRPLWWAEQPSQSMLTLVTVFQLKRVYEGLWAGAGPFFAKEQSKSRKIWNHFQMFQHTPLPTFIQARPRVSQIPTL